jgi:hypothetical protein
MQWINNLSLRNKLILMVGLPLLALIYFAVSGIAEKSAA